MCLSMSSDGTMPQVGGFATAEQFEAAFGQTSDFSREPAASEGVLRRVDLCLTYNCCVVKN